MQIISEGLPTPRFRCFHARAKYPLEIIAKDQLETITDKLNMQCASEFLHPFEIAFNTDHQSSVSGEAPQQPVASRKSG